MSFTSRITDKNNDNSVIHTGPNQGLKSGKYFVLLFKALTDSSNVKIESAGCTPKPSYEIEYINESMRSKLEKILTHDALPAKSYEIIKPATQLKTGRDFKE